MAADTLILLIVFLALALVMVSVMAVAALAFRRPGCGISTAGDNSPVSVGRMLPDKTIAALEDSLAYLALAGDALAGGDADAASRSVKLARFILAQHRAGQYRRDTSVNDLLAQFATTSSDASFVPAMDKEESMSNPVRPQDNGKAQS